MRLKPRLNNINIAGEPIDHKNVLFFMYLKKVYRHNKLLFAAIILFAAAHLINNIRQDIAISPLYSYGMYSQRITPSNSYTVPEIFVNGKQLQTQNFSPQQWDNISLPVTKFYAQQDWNLNQWQQDIHRLLPFTDSLKFVNSLNETDFKNWYKLHLQFVLKQPVDSVQTVFTDYFFNGNSFAKANK